jgi:phosphoribosylanthranilate isomerase
MLAIKICCIGSVEEAHAALAAGATALGLVSAMPSGPGVIDEARIAEIVAAVPAGTRTFLLTSAATVDAVVAQQRRARATTLQLVDALPPGAHAALRTALPGVELVQVVHVGGPAALDEAEALAAAARAGRGPDALLLDSGNPSLAVKELGGTGRRHDWAVSRAIVERVAPLPVYLAGGLHAGNAAEAVRTVRPFGLDVCSGVRTDGRLDPARAAAFVRAAGAGLVDSLPSEPAS